jgi:hypothetical protein
LGCSEYKNGCTWAKTIWVHGDWNNSK